MVREKRDELYEQLTGISSDTDSDEESEDFDWSQYEDFNRHIRDLEKAGYGFYSIGEEGRDGLIITKPMLDSSPLIEKLMEYDKTCFGDRETAEAKVNYLKSGKSLTIVFKDECLDYRDEVLNLIIQGGGNAKRVAYADPTVVSAKYFSSKCLFWTAQKGMI